MHSPPVFHAFLTHFLAYMATKTGLREHSGMVNGPIFGPVEWEKTQFRDHWLLGSNDLGSPFLSWFSTSAKLRPLTFTHAVSDGLKDRKASQWRAESLRNMASAWEKVCGRNFALTSVTTRLHHAVWPHLALGKARNGTVCLTYIKKKKMEHKFLVFVFESNCRMPYLCSRKESNRFSF